jgi:NAD(P) transhydrogenase subunit beta
MYVLVEVSLAVAILWGIRLMRAPETAARGNRLAALSLLVAILVVLWPNTVLTLPIVLASLAIGGVLGLLLAFRVTMLQMPQMVALLNGLGGAASMLTAFVAADGRDEVSNLASRVTGGLAVAVGGVTLGGSFVAAAKLHRLLPQRPIRLRGEGSMTSTLLFLLFLLILLGARCAGPDMTLWLLLVATCALVFGTLFALPVGGADMPITISLLNSMSGVAASICGFVVDDALLVAAGAIVGAGGLILTRVMCAAMNRSLVQVLTGATVASANASVSIMQSSQASLLQENTPGPIQRDKPITFDPVESLLEAQNVIIIPGYGMALGEAETQVRDLYDALDRRGKDVRFAIHPVAGRMPGHMTVLLADVDIPYDRLVQLETINPDFARTDVVLIVGACDVVNPAAITAEGTPIYGMPILHAHEAKRVIICNADTKPGYSGIENPLYSRDNVVLLLGNAASTLENLLNELILRTSAQDEVVC